MFNNNRVLNGKIIFGIAFPLFIIIFFSSINSGCKNPNEYKPPFDSLSPPPSAPQLISPKNDTVMYYQTPHPHDVTLKWSVVDDAQYYLLQIANDSTTLSDVDEINVETDSCIYTVTRNSFYFWRVRAYSRKWTWYTEWSETRHFGAFYSP